MKKKLLVITPRFPYPVVGGDRVRIYFVCKELSKLYDLTLVSLCESRVEMKMPLPDDGVFKVVERFFLPRWRSYLNCLIALPGVRPLQVAYYSSRLFRKKIDELVPKHDLAFSHLIRTGDYLRYANIPKVIEMTDAISMNYERVGEIAKSSGFKNLVYSLEQKRLKMYEQDTAEHFDLLFFVSPVDKDYLFSGNPSVRDKVLVCSNGVSLDLLNCNYRPDGKTIIFIGNMSSVQNLDAARWFAKSVMPELVRYGDFSFKIIGRMSDKNREEFKRYVNTITTGGVDNVADAAKGAIAGVCPMRLGAGVQNKVLEYMAFGIPAVTSSIGLEGIEAKVDEEILVGNTVGEYITIIRKISDDIGWATKIGESGSKFVQVEHTWEGKLAPMLDRINTLLCCQE